MLVSGVNVDYDLSYPSSSDALRSFKSTRPPVFNLNGSGWRVEERREEGGGEEGRGWRRGGRMEKNREEEQEREKGGRDGIKNSADHDQDAVKPTASFSSSVNFFPNASPTALCSKETKMHTVD